MNSQSNIKIEAVCMREEVMGYCLGRQPDVVSASKVEHRAFQNVQKYFQKNDRIVKKLGKIRSFHINKLPN